ncbi:MAG: hypothetical protein ACI4J5_06285 [Oscillospiraceae bacterium]
MQERKAQISANTVRLIFLLVFSAAGVIFGASACAGGELAASAAERISAVRSTSPLWRIVGTSFRGTAFLTAACFLLGFSAVAQPAEAMVPFFFGTGFGAFAAGMWKTGGIMCAAAAVPGGVISAFAVSVAAREAMRMSEAVFRRTFLPDEYTPADVKLYIKKFMIILVIGAAASAADGVFTLLFSAFGG